MIESVEKTLSLAKKSFSRHFRSHMLAKIKSLYVKPRIAIEANPRLGFWAISSVYGIASTFFFAHFYSLGFSHSFPLLFLSMIAIGPFLGAIFLMLDTWIFHKLTTLPFSHCQTLLVTSKLPYLLALSLWLLFFAQDPTLAFLHVSSEGSALFIALLTIAVYASSFFLLVQMVREIQSTSLLRSFLNVFLLSILSFLVISASMFVLRFVYLFLISLF